MLVLLRTTVVRGMAWCDVCNGHTLTVHSHTIERGPYTYVLCDVCMHKLHINGKA